MIASSKISQRLMSLCAFLTAFTIVMTILIYYTDLRGRRYRRIPLNLSIITDFENAAQDDPQLISYIREKHLRPPPLLSTSFKDNETVEQPEFAEIFESKKGGIFIETGAYRHGDESRTYWLEKVLGWRGLLTQPDPHDFNVLTHHANSRRNSYTANVCLSPTSNPKEVSFRQLSSVNDSQVPTVLTKVQCFPLYSLLLAYNATMIDFLSLNAEKAEFQVLKTLPFHKVNIRMIGIVPSFQNERDVESQVAQIMKLLNTRHYKFNKKYSTNNQFLFVCSRGPNGCYAPKISI